MPDSLCSLLQTLDSILNVEMVKDKSAEEIKQVMNLNRLNFVLHLCLIVIYVGEWEFYLKIRLKSKTWLYVHKKKKRYIHMYINSRRYFSMYREVHLECTPMIIVYIWT